MTYHVTADTSGGSAAFDLSESEEPDRRKRSVLLGGRRYQVDSVTGSPEAVDKALGLLGQASTVDPLKLPKWAAESPEPASLEVEYFERAAEVTDTQPVREIRWSQGQVIAQVQANMHRYGDLHNVCVRFDGLCELISNYVLERGILDRDDLDDTSLFNQISADALQTNRMDETHIHNLFSTLRLVIALLLRVYPDDMLSWGNHIKSLTKDADGQPCVRRKVLKHAMAKTENGTTMKLEIFARKGIDVAGHSMLIKKHADDNYSFFDPNEGLYTGLSEDQLMDKMDAELRRIKATDMLLIKGDDFLKRLEKMHLSIEDRRPEE